MREIRTIWIMPTVAMLALIPLLLSGALAQNPVEAAFVRGHFSDGEGIWRADDFGWFFYDLDSDQSGEQLRIDIDARTAEKGHIVYTSRVWPRQFEFKLWGNYDAVAFLGQPYLVGYPESSFAKEVNMLGKGELRKVLLDEKEIHTLDYNMTLPLQEGYVLTIAEISEKNDVANFVLFKNGKIVYSSVVNIGGTFVYKVGDIPQILVHLANAMRSENSGFAEVDGIFQVSDEPIFMLFEGGKLGNMKLTDLSESGFEFQNDKTLQFTRNTIVPLTSNLVIVVLDYPDLVYYPEGGFFNYGLHEIRGPTFNSSSSIPILFSSYNSSATAYWNFENYNGFYFDPEKALGSESLILYRINDRKVSPPSKLKIDEANNTVVQEGFQYTTFIQPKQFEFEQWGRYFVISFLGTQWFAGYNSSLEGQKAPKSLLENEYLGLVLIDREPRGIVLAGNYTLAEGYEMRIIDVGNDSIFLQLLKNEKQVDSSVIKSNTTYIYKKDIGDVDDMPIIIVHVNNAFNNGSQRFAVIDGIFQISDQYILPIEPGLDMGKMEIVSIKPNLIAMVNNENVNLNRDSTVAIAPGMNIRIADNDTLRYYLYTARYVVPKPNPPQIDIFGNATPHEPANFSMVVHAAEIRRVIADILDSSDRTVFSRDITKLAQGSGEIWKFSWKWNATTLQQSDDNSPILDSGSGMVQGLLYLDQSSPFVQVGVKLDSSGRIAAILDSKSIYYISRSEYENLNVNMDYDAMLANETARKKFLQIEPGKSVIQFFDIIDGKPVPSGFNHTLQGSEEALEPHAVRVEALPGRYELRVRVENIIDAIQVFGGFFNVTHDEMLGISLGSSEGFAKETVSIPLEAPTSGEEKRIEISYDATVVKPTDISGECNPSWQVDPREGRISVLLPASCGSANLSFASKQAVKENVTTYLEVINVSGFSPKTVSNGSITIMPSNKATEMSDPVGFITALTALAMVAYIRRRT